MEAWRVASDIRLMMFIDSKPAIVRYCLCLLLLLSACTDTTPVVRPQPQILNQAPLEETADDMLRQATSSIQPEARYHWILRAANKLIEEGETAKAVSLLENIPSQDIGLKNLGSYTLLYAQWALDQKLYPLAGSLLTDPRIPQITRNIEFPQATDLLKLRANYFEQSWQFDHALEERLSLSPLLLNTTEINKNNNAIWRIINQLPEDQLQKMATKQAHSLLKAWLELATITRNHSIDIQPQLTALANWKQQWAGHPAMQSLPAEVTYLEALDSRRPQQITLLLPQTGVLASAGQAVINGFLAAFYQASTETGDTPFITIIDSNSNTDFLALYQSVATSGTDFIIGPLDKNRVNKLLELNELPVPTLALNYAENPALSPPGLLQFGLNPEDDVDQALEYAVIQGYHKAMVLVPESEWGERLAKSFVDGWQMQGGSVSTVAYFDNQRGNYSSVISHALGIDESKTRMKNISRTIRSSLEFEPRRRQDIDVVFLSARPEDARQIKPMLAFHYAQDLPVLATSTIYNGYDDPIRDNDLNGILFTAIPWHTEQSAIKISLEANMSDQNNFQNLYALGVDAYRLHLRSGLLSSSPTSQINGSTGVLHLPEHSQRIQRQQEWMRMRSGRARLLTSTH